jgi:hypothetical protein
MKKMEDAEISGYMSPENTATERQESSWGFGTQEMNEGEENENAKLILFLLFCSSGGDDT